MASIFCDGACRGNGTRHAIAGWAWAYWPGVARGEPARSGSGRPPGAATNQRAELTALLEALRWWSGPGGGGPVTIYTDSMYTINCTSKWGPSWKRAGWKRAGGEIIQNLDLIQPLVALWQPKWKLVHVRGHQTGSSPEAHGNNWVDRAAVAASIGTPVRAVVSAPVHEVDVIELVPAEVFEDKVFIAPTDRAPVRKPIGKPVGQVDIRNWFVYKDA